MYSQIGRRAESAPPQRVMPPRGLWGSSMNQVPSEASLRFGAGALTSEDFYNLPKPDIFEIDGRRYVIGLGEQLEGVQIVPLEHRVLISTSLAILDADETQLADTLEHFHDGIHGRFAQAVLRCLSAAGLEVSPEQLDRDGFWTNVRNELSGQTEDGWEKGLSELVPAQFKVSITVGALQSAMRDVLSREQVEQFTKLVKPVTMIRELCAALTAQGVPRHLCTTTDEHIIRPLLDKYGLLEGVQHCEFGATKKIKDPEAPGGQVFKGEEVSRCLKVAGVSARSAVMFGDSIADWGTAAAAGVSTVVLRPANFLIKKHGGYEGAALELKKQVEQARKDYPNLTQTKVVIVAGFDNLRVLPMRKDPENQRKKPTIVWTAKLKS